jgi:hypothetical protein
VPAAGRTIVFDVSGYTTISSTRKRGDLRVENAHGQHREGKNETSGNRV